MDSEMQNGNQLNTSVGNTTDRNLLQQPLTYGQISEQQPQTQTDTQQQQALQQQQQPPVEMAKPQPNTQMHQPQTQATQPVVMTQPQTQPVQMTQPQAQPVVMVQQAQPGMMVSAQMPQNNYLQQSVQIVNTNLRQEEASFYDKLAMTSSVQISKHKGRKKDIYRVFSVVADTKTGKKTKQNDVALIKIHGIEQSFCSKLCMRPQEFKYKNAQVTNLGTSKGIKFGETGKGQLDKAGGRCYKCLLVITAPTCFCCGFLNFCCGCCAKVENTFQNAQQRSVVSIPRCRCCLLKCICPCICVSFQVKDQQGRFTVTQDDCSISGCCRNMCCCLKCMDCCNTDTYNVKHGGEPFKMHLKEIYQCCGCKHIKNRWQMDFPAGTSPQQKVEYINALILCDKENT